MTATPASPIPPRHSAPLVAGPPSTKSKGSPPKELRDLARARLKEAKILLTRKKYDGATYLCGYAVELLLKARICKTLKWSDYKIGRGYETFKTHELATLLELSGIRPRIITKYFTEWSAVNQWTSEDRYLPIGHTTPQSAIAMITATTKLMKAI